MKPNINMNVQIQNKKKIAWTTIQKILTFKNKMNKKGGKLKDSIPEVKIMQKYKSKRLFEKLREFENL